MENENIENIDSQNDENLENVDSQNDNAEEKTEEQSEVDYKALYEAEKKNSSKLYARLKKDEGKPETAKKPQPEQGLSREEARLIAKGHSDEEIEDIKFIADRYNLTLDQASNDKRFLAIKEVKDAEVKSQQAALRASQGSKYKEPMTFDTAKDDDHKKLFEKEFGR